MKKIIAAAIIFILAISLFSCGKDGKKLTDFEKTVGDINKLSAAFDEAMSILPEGSTVYSSSKNTDSHKGFVSYNNFVLLYGTKTVREIGTVDPATVTENAVYVFNISKLIPLHAEVKLVYAVKQMTVSGGENETVKQYLSSEAKDNGADEKQLSELERYFNGEKIIVSESSALWGDTLYSQDNVSVDFNSGRYDFVFHSDDSDLTSTETYENGKPKTVMIYDRHPDGVKYLLSVAEYRENGNVRAGTSYHANGSVKQTDEYPDGWPIPSKTLEYYDDGSLKTDLTRVLLNDGEFDYRAVRTTSTAYHQNGKKSSEIYYDDNGAAVTVTYDEEENRLFYSHGNSDGIYFEENYYPGGGGVRDRLTTVEGYNISFDEFHENGYIKYHTDYFEQSSSIKSVTAYSENIENFILERTEYYHMDVTIVEVELFIKSYTVYPEGWDHPRSVATFYNDGTPEREEIYFENGQMNYLYEYSSGGKLSLKKSWTEEGGLISHEEYYKSGTIKYHMGYTEDEGVKYQFVINYGDDGSETDVTYNYEDGAVKLYKFHANGNLSYYSYHDKDGNLVDEMHYDTNGEEIN